MARETNTEFDDLVAVNTGNEMYSTLEIEWVSEETKTIHSDKDDIISISSINDSVTYDQIGGVIQISVTLSDTQDKIKNLMDVHGIFKKPCRIYQHIVDDPEPDKVLVADGIIVDPVVYDVQNKTLRFDVIEEVQSIEVGFAPESGLFPFVKDQDIGQPWPLCFGNVVHVPATQYRDIISGQVMNGFFLNDPTLDIKIIMLQAFLSDIQARFNEQVAYYNKGKTLRGDLLEVRNNYIDTIKLEDALKQEIEDINLKILTLQEQFDDLKEQWYEDQSNESLKDRLSAVIEARDNLIYGRDAVDDDPETVEDETVEAIEGLTTKLRKLKSYEAKKEAYLLDAETAEQFYEYSIDIVDRIVELYKKYVEISRDLVTMLQVKSYGYSYTCWVYSGTDFPQDTLTTFKLDDTYVLGKFNGNLFSIFKVLPTYNQFDVTQDATELNVFYVPDTTYQLSGMYCYTNNNRIIKVTDQQGNRCEFELIQNTSAIGNVVDATDENISDLEETIGEMLDPHTTRERIQEFLNAFPEDISHKAIERLCGDGIVEYQIKVSNVDNVDLSDSQFKLNVNGYTTQWIAGDADSDEIKRQINLLPPYDYLTDISKFSVAGIIGDTDTPMTIAFQPKNWVDEDDPVPAIAPYITIERQDVTRTDSTIVSNFYLETVTDGASEYTLKEKAKLLDEAFEDDDSLAFYNETKKKVQEFFNFLNESTDKIKASGPALKAKLDNLAAIKEKVNFGKLNLEEVKRLISEDEQEAILLFEQLAYAYWLLELRPFTITDNPKDYFVTNRDFTFIKAAGPKILPEWMGYYYNTSNVDNTRELVNKFQELPASPVQYIPPGSEITEAGIFSNRFVANIIPSTLKAVYGIYNGRLAPVPSSLYTVTTPTLGSMTPMILSTVFPLTTLGWDEDQIYVTLDSSVGPNTVDIIEFILNNFTNITPDTASFAHVKSKVTNYPSSFALFNKRDAMELMKEICWQARLGFWTRNKKAYLRYLPEEPTPVHTFDNSNIDEGSLRLTYTDPEDVITKITGTWRPNYYTEPSKIILRQNANIYDENPEERDLYIYNIKSLAYKSLSYWMMRWSQVWKIAEFSTSVDSFKVEKQDIVTIDLPGVFATGSIVGVVLSTDYDSDDHTIQYKVWLPLREIDMEQWNFAFPHTVSELYTSQNINFGALGSPAFPDVPSTRTDLEEGVAFTPQDYPIPELGDVTDELPDSPTVLFAESDEETPTITETPKPKEIDVPVNVKGRAATARFTKVTSKKKENSVYFGRIIKKSDDQEDYSLEGIEGADEELDTITSQYYDVITNEGFIVKVRQLQIRADDTIPANTPVMFIWNAASREYQMQLLVFLEDDVPLE